MADDTKGPRSINGAKVMMGAAILSFCIGLGLFLTIAQTKSGDAIPPDAAPHYYIHDAG